MKKEIKYTHSINCKLTEQQFNDLQTIKENSGQSISKLMRSNIIFLMSYYQPKDIKI